MDETIDAAMVQNAGVYLVNQLERLDKTINLPLIEFTWPRDIDQRNDIEISDEILSFIRVNYHAMGQGKGSGKSWFSDKSTVVPEVSVTEGKKPQPVHLWAEGMSHSIFEIARASRLGRNLDDQKTQAINEKWNRDVNDMVYVGDKDTGDKGLCNHSDVKAITVSDTWANLKAADIDSAPDKILAQIDASLDASWTRSNRTMVASRILLPPSRYALLVGTRMKDGNDRTVMRYIKENCLSTESNNRPVEIYPCKELAGAGANGKDRMVLYTKNPRFLRFPVTMLHRTAPQQQHQLHFSTVFYCAMSAVEMIYPETVLYVDGI